MMTYDGAFLYSEFICYRVKSSILDVLQSPEQAATNSLLQTLLPLSYFNELLKKVYTNLHSE